DSTIRTKELSKELGIKLWKGTDQGRRRPGPHSVQSVGAVSAVYRAKIEKIEGPGRVQVFYVDYGNRESVPASRLGTLPGDYSLQAFPAQAHEYAFAFIQVPDDEEARSEAVDCLVRDVQNSQCLLNVEYRGNTCEHVTLLLPESREDVGLGLMREGMVIVEKRKEKRFTKLVADYQKAQDGAKASRVR
uniref:Tudor domain-containing protein n=1 Tax=Eptatretus burgeri TaxID=7764 RepID=A0A8C4WYU1_EPTBU